MTVTPDSEEIVMEWAGEPWNPWAALRRRPRLRLVWADLDCGGLIEDDGHQRRIVIDARLGRCDRNAVLAHELIHDEWDLLFTNDTPDGLIERGEERVRRETAQRLVPLTLLGRYVERVVELGEPVHAASVAEEFDVPLEVAHRALFLLEQRRG